MGYYVCTVCGCVFHHSIKMVEDSYTSPCPIANCCGQIFECDEEMIVPILTLNDKGYITQFCCSGHLYENPGEGYVRFFSDCIPDTAPSGWTLNGNTIRYRYSKDASPVKKLKERHKKIEALVKWTEELDNIMY